MLSVPLGRAVVLKEALPLAPTAAVPRLAPPFRKVMVPVGVVEPVTGVTVAVKVTLWPELILVAEAARVVFVAVTVCVTFTMTAEETELESAGVPA